MRGGLYGLMAAVALHLSCAGGKDDPHELAKMPALSTAVVVAAEGELFPSAAGPDGSPDVPLRVFAVDETFAEVQRSHGGSAGGGGVTISGGDEVEVLIAGRGPEAASLVRTRFGTYCWIRASALGPANAANG